MLVNRAAFHKMHVRIANREDTDQTASSDNELISTAILLPSTDSRRVIVSPKIEM